MWAAENDHLDIVKALIEEDNSLINSKDGDGYSPLHRASYNGHTEIINVRKLCTFVGSITAFRLINF